jgi:DNA polymerase-4
MLLQEDASLPPGTEVVKPLRRIIHVDLDHFYSQVEIRDDPRLRGRPVAVGGEPPRGVIATASYEARRFGVGSALATSIALQRCPQLILLPPRMKYYREVSARIHEILNRHTDLIEPLSLDEAFLDVTEPKNGPRSGTLIARSIRRQIRQEVGLTASAGVSYCKFLAKTASGMNKPDGLTVITPKDAAAFLEKLPVERFFGVGRVTADRLKAAGIHDAAGIRSAGASALQALLGKTGLQLFELAHGRDERPVDPERERKSVSTETTFLTNLETLPELVEQLPPLAAQVARTLRQNALLAGTVVIKVKFADHSLITRQQALVVPARNAALINQAAADILQRKVELLQPVRLLGVGAHALQAEDASLQQPLFPELTRWTR